MKLSAILQETIDEAIGQWVEHDKYIRQEAKKRGVDLGNALGSGVWGITYEIAGTNKVFKVTTDYDEYSAAKWLVGKESEYLANIYHTEETEGGWLFIVMERLQPLNKEYKKALNQFYLGLENYSYLDAYDVDILPDVLSRGLDKDFEFYLKNEFPEGVMIYHQLLHMWNEATVKHKLAPLTDLHGENMGMKNGHLAIFDIK